MHFSYHYLGKFFLLTTRFPLRYEYHRVEEGLYQLTYVSHTYSNTTFLRHVTLNAIILSQFHELLRVVKSGNIT